MKYVRPRSPFRARPGRTACGGRSRKRASRPAAGVTISGRMTSTPRERKRCPSGSTNHQRPSILSTRKKPVACAFVEANPPKRQRPRSPATSACSSSRHACPQVLDGPGFPRPRVMHVLPHLVHEGQAVEDGVARRGLLQPDRPYLQRRGADGLLHLEPDRLDVVEWHEGTPEPEEVAHPRAVADGRHVVSGGRRLRQHRYGNGGAEPDARVRMEEEAAEPLCPGASREDLQVDALGRRRPHLQDERLVSRPVAREVRGKVERARSASSLFASEESNVIVVGRAAFVASGASARAEPDPAASAARRTRARH